MQSTARRLHQGIVVFVSLALCSFVLCEGIVRARVYMHAHARVLIICVFCLPYLPPTHTQPRDVEGHFQRAAWVLGDLDNSLHGGSRRTVPAHRHHGERAAMLLGAWCMRCKADDKHTLGSHTPLYSYRHTYLLCPPPPPLHSCTCSKS